MNDPGPFDRMLESSAARDKTARAVLIAMGILGILLLVLVLFGGSLLDGGDGNSPPSTSTNNSASSTTVRLPKVPDGYEALSPLVRPGAGRDVGPAEITVGLAQPVSDGRNLGFYTYRDSKWERIGTANLINNGASAKGQVTEVPANVAVLRRITSAVVISGWVMPGSQVDPAALDVLTTLNPVDYLPTAEGAVLGQASLSNASGKVVLPTVRATSPAALDAVNTIIASSQLRETHVNNLVQVALQPGYTGIDIDYPGVLPARRPDFTAFIATLADRLHSSNRQLTITLPTPTKAGINWDTGAFDWKELGRYADYIKLVPELDPSIYYRRMEEIAAFLKPNVDLGKVVLVLGRASKEKASNGIRQMPLREALALATTLEVRTSTAVTPNSSVLVVGKNIFQDDGASGIRWDETAFAVSFSYPGAGGQRTVWFENSLSVAFKLDLARRMGFGGVHLDNVALDGSEAALWTPFISYVENGTVKLVQPNGVLLRPVWQSQAGSIEPGQKGNVVWKAPPQAGIYDVSLIVSDGIVRASQKVILDVKPAQAPTPFPGGSGTPRPAGTVTATPQR